MLRSMVKGGMATAIHSLRVEKVLGARLQPRNLPLIICYHRVVADFEESARQSIPSLLVGVDTFTRHLDWIGNHYDFATLDEVLVEFERVSANGKPRRRPLAAITFDDGYADVLHNAVPVMNSKGVPGTMFVVTDLVGSTDFQMHDELYLMGSHLLRQDPFIRRRAAEEFLKELAIDEVRAALVKERIEKADPYLFARAILEVLGEAEQVAALRWLKRHGEVDSKAGEPFRTLSWSELEAMQRRDVTIGSHTRSHALLPQVTPQVMAEELTLSREILEQKLGKPVRHFAYPDGRFCRDSVDAVADAGYRGGYTICGHTDPRHPTLTIPRKGFGEHTCSERRGNFSAAILSCQVNGIFDPARLCTHQHGPM